MAMHIIDPEGEPMPDASSLGAGAATAVGAWKPMASAPKDGSRILVVIRASEQGPADVDVVRWTRPTRAEDDCWVSTDSSHDCAIIYEDWEVAFWMPLPPTFAPVKTTDMASRLPRVPREGEETEGSGI
jgi:hypothetical protein